MRLLKLVSPALLPPDVVPPRPEHLLRVRVTHHPRHEGGAQHRHDVRAFLLSSLQQENPENVEANVSPRFIGNCKQCKETDTGKQVNT